MLFRFWLDFYFGWGRGWGRAGREIRTKFARRGPRSSKLLLLGTPLIFGKVRGRNKQGAKGRVGERIVSLSRYAGQCDRRLFSTFLRVLFFFLFFFYSRFNNNRAEMYSQSIYRANWLFSSCALFGGGNARRWGNGKNLILPFVE